MMVFGYPLVFWLACLLIGFCVSLMYISGITYYYEISVQSRDPTPKVKHE